MRTAGRLLLAPLVVAALAACRPPPPAPPPFEPARLEPGIAADRAYEDLRRLASIGPRPTGSLGAERARSYLRAELEQLGLEVREMRFPQPGTGPKAEDEAPAAEADAPAEEDEAPAGEGPPAEIVHLTGVIPGASDGRGLVVLAAAYDTPPDGAGPAANGSASGPAAVLELARAIAADPLPYTTWVVFLDGDAGGADRAARTGSRLWVRELHERGDLERIRAAFFFRQVADPDLRIERDLFSHHRYRETLWEAASKVGAREAFPPDGPFATPASSHLSLVEAGVRRVVAVVDDAYGGTEAPGAWAGTEEDRLENTSRESLAEATGASLVAVREIAALLRKVDRLSPAPPPPQESAEATPDEAGAAPAPDEAEGAPGEAEAAPDQPEGPPDDTAPAPDGTQGEGAE